MLQSCSEPCIVEATSRRSPEKPLDRGWKIGKIWNNIFQFLCPSVCSDFCKLAKFCSLISSYFLNDTCYFVNFRYRSSCAFPESDTNLVLIFYFCSGYDTFYVSLALCSLHDFARFLPHPTTTTTTTSSPRLSSFS